MNLDESPENDVVSLIRYWITKAEMLMIEKKALLNILKDREIIVTSEEYFVKLNEASEAYIKERAEQTKRELKRYGLDK
jgi:hypothetical protein